MQGLVLARDDLDAVWRKGARNQGRIAGSGTLRVVRDNPVHGLLEFRGIAIVRDIGVRNSLDGSEINWGGEGGLRDVGGFHQDFDAVFRVPLDTRPLAVEPALAGYGERAVGHDDSSLKFHHAADFGVQQVVRRGFKFPKAHLEGGCYGLSPHAGELTIIADHPDTVLGEEHGKTLGISGVPEIKKLVCGGVELFLV